MRRAIRFRRKGRTVELSGFPPALTVLDWLRLHERSTGTKEGCAEGDCGACTVVLARAEGGRVVHRPVCACIALAGQLDGAELLTVEDLGGAHPVQRAMVEHHGSQCGFCTPGIVMSLFALHADAPRPVGRQAVVDQLAGNLCRCTGYRPIVAAALAACAEPRPEPDEARRAALAALPDEEDVLAGDEARFFAAPASLDAAAELLERHPDATILSGGTDVGLWVTKRLQELPKIVWLGRVRELGAIEDEPDALRLGAGVTHADAAARLAAIDPDLGELVRRFGSVQVRALGTVGGNIANGSPIGDLAPALIALGATLHLRHGAAARDMLLERFFLAYGRQDRAAGELVTGVAVPKLKAGERFRAFKLTKRFDEDISAVMLALKVTLDGGVIRAARLACGGMGPTQARAPRAEAALAGRRLDDPATGEAACGALALDYRPISDMRASAEYRMRGAQALLRRALAEMAGAGGGTRLVGHRPALEAAE
jgi:xanthine dehydrogenase small subunit